MSRTLVVRNLPDEVHARLQEHAAAEQMCLSDYVARELERLVRRRNNAEVFAEARSHPVEIDSAALVAAVRRERGR